MIRFKAGVASCAAILVLAGCSRDSNSAKTDSAAADSIRTANAAETGAAPTVGAPTASVLPPVNSTAGTIGETRKRPRLAVPDTMDRDSVIAGPYKRMDSTGAIKR